MKIRKINSKTLSRWCRVLPVLALIALLVPSNLADFGPRGRNDTQTFSRPGSGFRGSALGCSSTTATTVPPRAAATGVPIGIVKSTANRAASECP